VIQDLRDFLAACRDIGEVRDVPGADWNEEIGALTEAAAELIDNPPALLFDSIKGYPAGYRVFSLPLASHRRIAVALGLDPDATSRSWTTAGARRWTRACRRTSARPRTTPTAGRSSTRCGPSPGRTSSRR
jgi:3-polyprenyl-4-hydroxybenzoate decarboxylase